MYLSHNKNTHASICRYRRASKKVYNLTLGILIEIQFFLADEVTWQIGLLVQSHVSLVVIWLWKLQLILCADKPIFVGVKHPENEIGLLFAHLKAGQLVQRLPELLLVESLLVHDVLEVVHVREEALQRLEALGAACVNAQLPELTKSKCIL